jgi:hypothetical protein
MLPAAQFAGDLRHTITGVAPFLLWIWMIFLNMNCRNGDVSPCPTSDLRRQFIRQTGSGVHFLRNAFQWAECRAMVTGALNIRS